MSKLEAARINDFCKQVFGRGLDPYEIRLFDFARLVEAEASAAEREAWGNPCAWMNADGFISTYPGGGYDIPLHRRSNAIGQGSAACGASPAPTGYTAGD